MNHGNGTRADEARTRLERLAREEAPALLAYFVRRVVDRQDADELLSEVYVALASRPGKIPAEVRAARMWAFGIARRVLLAHRRRAMQNNSHTESEAVEWCVDPAGFPGDAGDAERQEVRVAIAELTKRQREIVILVHWEGFALAEAAHHLGMRPSTARTHYERARTMLRALLADPAEDRAEDPAALTNYPLPVHSAECSPAVQSR